MRKLQTRWSGLEIGKIEGLAAVCRRFFGAPMAACSGCGERDGGERARQEALADRTGASWRGRWVSGGRAPSGWEWQGAQPCQGAAELAFPGPMLWQMQSEAARRAGNPSGQGEEASSEGLGGHDLLTQADPRRPAGQVVGHHLYRQPSAVGGEARPEGMWFKPTPYLRSRMAFSISAWRR